MPRTGPSWALRAGRVLIGLASAVAVAVTGTTWWTTRDVLGGFTVSDALPVNAERSGGGAMNILLIGLDSRKDQEGNELPQEILDQLHAGDSDSGGYNTNTLILVHISADNAVSAFSIPRDDWVSFNRVPGYHHIKIKEAYGLTKFFTEQKLADEGEADQAVLEKQGREAGRAATLSAVRNLVGVPIDAFAEVNLAGFYDLAKALGGVEVCLNHPVQDSYSGVDLPAGRQWLNASQALAFVRQRHGLDNGDLDRTHRQQAFLVSVVHQLQDAGTFSDLTKLNNLMDIARKDIVFSAGWDVDQFKRLGALADGEAQFQTLPVVRYDVVNGGDVNIVDPEQIKAQVRAAFSDGSDGEETSSAASRPSSMVEVVNAGQGAGVASKISRGLASHGYSMMEVRDATSEEATTTAIEYGSGSESEAEDISTLLDNIPADPNSALPAGQIRVVLGTGFTMPTDLEVSATTMSEVPDDIGYATPTTTTTSKTSATTTSATPDNGPPVDGGGIPCVN
ncbi:LCP family protein [Mycolicibacterium komossense]|uniref:LCP family protein n=1 Tax=Mycolicibacterium komossense TaxID=1779 RepID=A0ABT3CHZ8_9MYCO|nr:LCP family protein [Mycolicibacterium komossense]MCV7229146.1 LCP family protein [Mycolicibacterium komossense]